MKQEFRDFLIYDFLISGINEKTKASNNRFGLLIFIIL